MSHISRISVCTWVVLFVGWHPLGHAEPAVAAVGSATPATSAAPVALVPIFAPTHYATGLMREQMLPLSDRALQSAHDLVQAVQQHCGKPMAHGQPGAADIKLTQESWGRTLGSWSALTAVSLGPVLARRSVRAIDFQPTRPHLIERALQSALVDVRALEQVGSAAKGLPALEWLLWRKHAGQRLPVSACDYAVWLAQDIQSEIQSIQQGFTQQAVYPWAEHPQEASALMAETINQWVGGIEALRWREMGKPLAANANAPDFPRALSGMSRQAWQAQWQALRALSVQTGTVPRAGDFVALDTYLMGRGLIAPANQLRLQVQKVDQVMAQLMGYDDPVKGVTAVVNALDQLKLLAESVVAPALSVNIGFSDADGD